MKIIFANRSDCMTLRGGDTWQMIMTKKYLESMYDLKIDLCFNPATLSSQSCDIVHLFNIQTFRQTQEFINSAIKIKSKIALTPIYWDLKYSLSYLGLTKMYLYHPKKLYNFFTNPIITLNSLLPGGRYLSANYKKGIKYILTNSDIILPNSDEEWEIIKGHFDVTEQYKYKIIPNAIELSDFPMTEDDRKDRKIIQVGLISPIKNQLGTLLALLNKPELPLYFIGRVGDNNYYKYLRKKATKRGNVIFIDEITSEELGNFYKQSAIHVLPSFRESPGLVSLESFYSGCEIVVSDSRFVPVDYYRFNEIAHICNPYDPGSIHCAIINALSRPKNNSSIRERYFDFFNYKTVAERTYSAYNSIMKG
jgi:glycosyltransferase involved in cell wall biosynthesis